MVQTITTVWTAIVQFIVGLFGDISALFYTPASGSESGSLTFIGTLAVIMAGVGLLLLVFNLIRSFLTAKG